jgi:hypothetical protein
VQGLPLSTDLYCVDERDNEIVTDFTAPSVSRGFDHRVEPFDPTRIAAPHLAQSAPMSFCSTGTTIQGGVPGQWLGRLRRSPRARIRPLIEGVF